MKSLCLYFQVHQPFRLKDYSFFKIGIDHNYGATQQNYAILGRVSDLCYLPANELLHKLIVKGKAPFACTFSLSGTVIDQLEQFRPDVIESFQALAATGKVEFLAETYYHSLAFLFSRPEFERQVALHSKRITELFGKKPTSFRNTELIYSDELARAVQRFGFKAILAEGVGRNMSSPSAHGMVHQAADTQAVALLRNAQLSDDIAFRFTDQTWDQWPLTAEKFAQWLHVLEEEGSETVNLFIDYETFGEHRKKESGIFQFLEELPAAVAAQTGFTFATPSQIADAAQGKVLPPYHAEDITSWADADRDLSAWTADNMQKDALEKLYALEPQIARAADPRISEVWGRLQTSDHFYYMSTRFWRDPVHQVFSPYRSPYDAYINYMNVLMDLKTLL